MWASFRAVAFVEGRPVAFLLAVDPDVATKVYAGQAFCPHVTGENILKCSTWRYRYPAVDDACASARVWESLKSPMYSMEHGCALSSFSIPVAA